jgi:hypothetical protein
MSQDVSGDGARFMFIGGLHRSGTTLLHQCITDHAALNRFRKTDVPEDEGQFLQTVYPDDYLYGGPGQFGFAEAAHLTEASPLATPDNAARIVREWSSYWEKDARIYVEKTPRNLIHARFLKKLFPTACFVFLVRHPLAVAMATRKWSLSSLNNLVLHWLACHQWLLDDIQYLDDYMIFRYEDFIAQPQAVVDQVYGLAGVPAVPLQRKVRADGNRGYEAEWQDLERWATAKRFPYANRHRAGASSDWRQRGALRRMNHVLDRLGWGNRVQAYMPYAEVSAVYGHLRPQIRRFGYDLEDGRFVTLDGSVLPYVRLTESRASAA